MKLYELKRNSYFTFPDNPEAGVFHFHHIDGAYSLCTDDQGSICHFAAWAEVEPYEANNG